MKRHNETETRIFVTDRPVNAILSSMPKTVHRQNHVLAYLNDGHYPRLESSENQDAGAHGTVPW